MNNYDVVIGVEVHIEVKSKTKCFSSGPNTFAKTPNSQVNPIDAGYPGCLPVLNKEVVVKAIKLCNALNMEIDHILRFDRKNYFYPDLPKGYQITQYFHPIGKNGNLEIKIEKEKFNVEFERVHIEEDTAKQIHEKNETLLDYNRAGIPLLELVTRPIFTCQQQVISYINELRRILIHLDISDAKMNEGSLRCDLNISLKPKNSNVLGTKVEIKNLNSLNNISQAINFEIARQSKLLDNKEQVFSQTRRFDEKTNTTILMREKTTVIDYKYFPEPNIFPIALEESWVNNIINSMPSLPSKVEEQLKDQFQLLDNEVNFLLDRIDFKNIFFEVIKNNNLVKPTINFLLGPVQSYLNANNLETLLETKLTASNLADLINLINQKKVNDKQSKTILENIFKDDKFSPTQLVDRLNIKIIDDENDIEKLILEIFANNENMVKDYNINPSKANKFFMGQLMKITKGQVNPVTAQNLINKLIKQK